MGNLQGIANHIARMMFSAGYIYVSCAKSKKSSSKNLLESKKKSHHVCRSSIFRANSSEEQKKRSSRLQKLNFLRKFKWRANKNIITSAGRSLSCVTVFWHVFTVQYTEMLKRKTYGKLSITWAVCTRGPHLKLKRAAWGPREAGYPPLG